MADGATPRLQRITDYPALLDAAWAQAHAPRAANAPTVISTFAGCGGSSLGYAMAGYRELLAVEWEQNAAETFRLNFPAVPLYHGDIAKLSVEECLQRAAIAPGELDVFDGSPPCQGFSTVGKRDVGDSRNQLFREYTRLLSGLRPRAFVMENVSGMVKGDFKLVFAAILRALKTCGYRVKARLLGAHFYGVPQERERMIFVGIRDDVAAEPSHPSGWSEPVSLVAGLAGLAGLAGVREGFGPTHLAGVRNEDFENKWRSPLRPCCTVVKSRPPILSFTVGDQREMTPRECARVGSFPDGFQFIGGASKAVERIGNSVPPLLMRSIAAHVRTLLPCLSP